MSRLTFRDKAGTVCWQKQLRDKYLSEGTPPVPHLDVKRAEVRRVSRRLAQQIIYKYEWLGTMAPTTYHYGIFFGAYCAGVCCVGLSSATAGKDKHHEFGLNRPDELLTLARGACVHWAPTGANSKLVAWACRLLSRDGLGKALIAYSDAEAGEIGTIYQACGWVYIGKTKLIGEAEIVSPGGRVFNRKFVGNHAQRRAVTFSQMRCALLDGGWRFQSNNQKHKYVAILDKSDRALIARVERMRQPYPKRAASVDSDTAAHQAAEGGAHPTAALQNE